MDEAEYQRMAEAEDASWWFRGRRRVLDRVLSRLRLPDDAEIADLGCGTGGNLPMLARHGHVTGVEASRTAADHARRRHANGVVHAPAHATMLPTGHFDVVTMFDVLEHLDDEGPALHEVRRLLKPGGRLVLTVPAFPMLWSGHDVALHHRRRYRRGPLGALLHRSGLRVDLLTYYNAALFPPVAAVRLARRLTGGGSSRADVADALPAPIAHALEAVFAAEGHLIGRVPLPFGVSLIGVARTG
ncbi:MAG: class I SAM-dependent methyltransferase [Myxococcota bacterium]